MLNCITSVPCLVRLLVLKSAVDNKTLLQAIYLDLIGFVAFFIFEDMIDKIQFVNGIYLDFVVILACSEFPRIT